MIIKLEVKQNIQCKDSDSKLNAKQICSSDSGRRKEVYAFKTKEEILNMVSIFNKHIEEASNNNQRQIAARNKMLFIIGICVGLKPNDLCRMKWNDFYQRDGDSLVFRKNHTFLSSSAKRINKYIKITYISPVQKAVNEYVSKYPIENLEDYVFFSRNGKNCHIRIESLWKILNSAAKEAGIEQNIGTHSLRKTFGFWAWRCSADKNLTIRILSNFFGHSDEDFTRKYIGLPDEDVDNIFISLEPNYDF